MRNENSILLSGVYREGRSPCRTLKGGRGGTIVGSPRFFRFLSSEKGRNKKTTFVLVQTQPETIPPLSTCKKHLPSKSWTRNAILPRTFYNPSQHQNSDEKRFLPPHLPISPNAPPPAEKRNLYFPVPPSPQQKKPRQPGRAFSLVFSLHLRRLRQMIFRTQKRQILT